MKQSGKMKVMAALLAGIMLLGSGFSMKEASAMEQNHGKTETQKKAVKIVQTAGRDQLGDFAPDFARRIVKLSATPLRNRPHMVFCSQGTSWGAGSTHGTSVGCNPLAYP